MKKLLNYLWKLQFKKVPYSGKPAYKCRDCKAWQREFYCLDYELECDEIENFNYERRFKTNLFFNLLDKWKTLIS
jgi:hypothetical protein